MLKEVAKRLGLVARVRAAWNVDIERSARHLRAEMTRLEAAIERLSSNQQVVIDRAARMERDAQQIKHAFRLNDQQRALVAALDERLDPARVTAHVRRAIEATPLHSDPFPHIVVDALLPNDVYDLALQALPPYVFFSDRDPLKRNVRVPMEFAPTLSLRLWDFVDAVVARNAIRSAVLEKFAEPLQRHYDVIFGAAYRERAKALPQAVSGGRLMLRRAGYHLDPHRDPKRSLLTCLIYCARPHDSEAYGTQIFRVHDDREASYAQTYYPAENGGRCELVKVVPFRPNTALVFLNSAGAHGADIPATASRKVERYAFQFYIGPDQEALDALIEDLPPERQAMWRSKTELEVTGM